MLERLAGHEFRNWLLPGVLAALLVALFVAGPHAFAVLRYERAAVLGGEAWRLVTAHLVHFDLAHLAWNLVGLALVWLLFAQSFNPRGWLLILIASTAAVDLGFLCFERQLEWYVGFSGVLHGCMAAGLIAWLRTERDAWTALVAALFAAKLVWEHAVGPLPFTASTMSLAVVYQAHTYGAIGGALAGLWLVARRPSAGAGPV